nr:transmembrane protease serine 11D-like isoform X1 [Chrysemys picta bellii]XP_042713665.1 transmembrane protease serine 11D-like isoform X1 [Chrysemys picta bellii]
MVQEEVHALLLLLHQGGRWIRPAHTDSISLHGAVVFSRPSPMSKAVSTQSLLWREREENEQLTSAQNIPGQAEGIKTSRYFMGSFQLVNEIYYSRHSNSASDTFKREAAKLENVIAGAFGRSALNKSYQGLAVLALSPSPFTEHFRLQFSGTETSARLSNAVVAHELAQEYQGAGDKVEMSMDVGSLLVRDYGTCSSVPGGDTDAPWPWQAAERKNGDPACAGSLISEGWVLCMASCVTTRWQLEEPVRAQERELLFIERIIPSTIKHQTRHPYAAFAKVAPFVPWMQPYLLT